MKYRISAEPGSTPQSGAWSPDASAVCATSALPELRQNTRLCTQQPNTLEVEFVPSENLDEHDTSSAPDDDPAVRALATDIPRAIAQIVPALSAVVAMPAPAVATVALASDREVRTLNGTWRGQDKPTNVLSFPSPAPVAGMSPSGDVAGMSPSGDVAGKSPSGEWQRHFIGDVVLAQETVVREAAELGIPVGHHLRHLILHGLLHLLGYDHENDAEAIRMEGTETGILASIGIPDPYAGPLA